MKVIPAINCKDFKCVKEQIKKAVEFLPKNEWIQIDVGDGKFTKAKAWGEAQQLRDLRFEIKALNNLNIEAHLMVENPEEQIEKWARMGAGRVIIHAEAVNSENFKKIILKFKNKIGIAINPKTPIENLVPYLDKIKFVQLLAVKPGFSGQKFDKIILDKIKFLKENYPKILVEIDGGINEETVKLVKKAGADMVVSGSYIFKSKNPKEAYKKLSV